MYGTSVEEEFTSEEDYCSVQSSGQRKRIKWIEMSLVLHNALEVKMCQATFSMRQFPQKRQANLVNIS